MLRTNTLIKRENNLREKFFLKTLLTIKQGDNGVHFTNKFLDSNMITQPLNK